MALPPHSEFERMCTLAPLGELSAHEFEQLAEHLQYCDLCRSELAEQQDLLAALMTAFALERQDGGPEVQDRALERGKRRLMEAVETLPTKKRKPPLLFSLLLAVGFSAAGFAGGSVWQKQHASAQEQAAHRTVVPAREESVTPVAVSSHVSVPPTSDASQILQRLEHAQTEQRQLQQETEALRQRAQAAEQDASAKQEQLTTLSQRLAVAQGDVASLQDRAALAEKTLQTRTLAVDLELTSLRTAVASKDRIIADNDELLSHDRDIRDLMGARNLIIQDIYDVDEHGQKRKPVGRIFYTKDQRLLFYGYDLDKQRGIKQNAVFQAWGNNQTGKDVSLGVFYRDDANKRWVLKFNDASTLARLTSVFVTMEPSGGSNNPTGKHLLGASLRIDPNYP